MRDRDEVVLDVIGNAPNRELASRVRLQKTVYLLDQLGFGSGFSFDYHHFGPYARELDGAIADACAFGKISEELRSRASDGARYSLFKAIEPAEGAGFNNLPKGRVRELISRFARENVTVLELAATIDWLWRHEKVEDWQSEVRYRKGAKTGAERLQKAVALLSQIGLTPPSTRNSSKRIL